MAKALRRPLRHAASIEEVWAETDSSAQGLSQAEAAERLQHFGPNRLPQSAPTTWWEIWLRQFRSPLIYILIAAAVAALFAGDVTDAAFIGAVLLINAVIGSYQEWRAERSSRALQQLLHIRASVLRDGEFREIDAEELVPGDVVWLESGNRVPADLRLISARGLEIDESLLTGESIAVTKQPGWSGPESTPIADRLNLAYAASVVVHGRSTGVVVATATDTVVGELAVDVMSTSGGKPPLLERMERFARTISYAVLVAVGVVGALGILVHGYNLREMFLFAVALAVSAIPEGLPAALTVALAIATTRMARRGVIVRRLVAVEGLGSCTMIASDKTGTLTCNELTARTVRLADGREMEVSGEGFAPIGEVLLDGAPVQATEGDALWHLVRTAALCNEGDLHQRETEWVWRGDPTDIALLSFAHKAGVHRGALLARFPQITEIPFEPERQYAATFHRMNGHAHVALKGAPERVLGMCKWPGGDHERKAMQAAAEAMAERGLRVLALADGTAAADIDGEMPPEPTDLEFRGFAGMIDPLRPGVREAVIQCRAAGITVCMVTGDHPVTALAISRDLGLATDPEQVISGGELAETNADALRRIIRHRRVFARVTPRQKLELVQAARAEGHFVAVTGDGVNDAPAMRAANIGVAMGKSGTDVAREAAELVISDDNFATIVAGVEEGRVAYDNVRKVIYLLVSMGTAEVLLVGVVFALASDLPLPLWPAQLLWLNLVTNGIQGVALAFEPAEPGVLQRRPRPADEAIFNRLMIERTLVAGAVVALVGTIAFGWMIRTGWSADSARNVLLLLMVLFENAHIGNCRSELHSAFSLSPLRSPFLLFGALGAVGIHVVAMYLPILQTVLRTEPVSLNTWGVLVALALTIVVAIEIHKWTWRLRYGAGHPGVQEGAS